MISRRRFIGLGAAVLGGMTLPGWTMRRQSAKNAFRVLPYLQDPTPASMRVNWFTVDDAPGTIQVLGPAFDRTWTSKPEPRSELLYSDLEESQRAEYPDMFPNRNVKHSVVVDGLLADTRYRAVVRQGGEMFETEFRTSPLASVRRSIRIIAFADSETEPDGRKIYRPWRPGDQTPDSTGRPEGVADYLLTETEGFRENLRIVARREPELVLLPGDLVQGGGYQGAWDEFFFHLAGKWDTLMCRTPLIAALGNWECFGARNGGYEPQAVYQSRQKFRTYFDGPPNGIPEHQNVYYRTDYGPITILTLDSSNGLTDNTDADTNRNIDADKYPGKDLVDINPGSPQWNWTIAQLKDARDKGQIIFVQFHHIPYSSGGHSLPLTAPGSSGQAGLPMRVYTPEFEKYGVVAVICGHNESFERSVVHGIVFYDVGVAGDGLGYSLKNLDPRFENPWGRWVAHHDAPEHWRGKQLIDGGKHYGHLEIDFLPVGERDWKIVFTPVYAFPRTDADGQVVTVERRVYDDVVEIDYDVSAGRGRIRELGAHLKR